MGNGTGRYITQILREGVLRQRLGVNTGRALGVGQSFALVIFLPAHHPKMEEER